LKATPPLANDTLGFGVVVLCASAGGQSAVINILRELPLDFDVPIVVVQHLPAESKILDVYALRLPFTFEWIGDHSLLVARTVLMCPPRVCAELLPDGSFRSSACESGALDRQIDRLLHSVALSFGHRGVAVILTGMGTDGSLGARELKASGGRVVVQTADSAEFADMPRAAIASGAADLVVPLGDVAQVLVDLVRGNARPKALSELAAIEQLFGDEGEIAALAREMPWDKTTLGPVLEWPAELRTLLRTTMAVPHPAALWWGSDHVLLYNEAYRRFLGSKHPRAFGGRGRIVWAEIWDLFGAVIEEVSKTGIAQHRDNHRLLIDRHGFAEEVFAYQDYSPIRDARGDVVGLVNTCIETTRQVVTERRMTILRKVAAFVTGANTPREACEKGAAGVADEPRDLPFVLLYLFDNDRRQANLSGASGVAAGSAAAPHVLALSGHQDLWALQRVAAGTVAPTDAIQLDDLPRRVPDLQAALQGGGAERLLPSTVMVLPLQSTREKRPIGALVAGINPQRPLDEGYRDFLALLAQQVSGGVAEARARQLERERADRLAEIDRTKTEFFANVSHEFRTPLTLLLSPLEEMQRRGAELPAEMAAEIDLAVRNARRLFRLVDNLLDFSEIESRRQRATLHLTDLAALTTDVASAFRSAIERAGLKFRVECASNIPLVPVDPDMWEKILSNLVSNAIKFTFEGEILVRLHTMSLHVELVVADSGIGIPKHELPHIFKRFHRVRGARARTIEGSGIGLSMVHDLVSRMGGQVVVRSVEQQGTTFTVWIPLKSYRPTAETPQAEAGASARLAADLADEARSWFDDTSTAAAADETLYAPKGDHLRLAPGARVLVVDDNADLRNYLRRLLGAYWRVDLAADGEQALEAMKRNRPELVLADVMMPRLDGLGLLRAMRADNDLKPTPVIFLTARAAEDTAIEGLVAGADDYLAKPFSARELIARVGGRIMLSRSRRRMEELNSFLIRYSDQVRSLSDPVQVGQVACEMVLAELHVERAYWAEVDWATREFVVQGGAFAGDVQAIAGRFPLDAWEPFSDSQVRPRSHVVHDTQDDGRLAESMRAGYAQLQIGADLAAPVVVEGKLCCVLAVNQRLPRGWTPDEIALLEGVAGRCWAEVERARGQAAAVEAHRRAAARQAFLLRLSDVLRAQPDERSVKERALAMIADQFDPDRCYISEVFEAEGYSTVGPEHLRRGATPMTGRYRLTDYTEVMRQLATEPMVVHDADNDPRFSDEERKSLALVPQRALLVAPVRKGPTTVIWALVVAMGAARTWTEEERLLMQEAAERTWMAMQQARAEAELRDSESRYLALFTVSPVPILVLDTNAPDFTILAANDAYLAATLTRPDNLIGRRMFDVFTDDPDRSGTHGSEKLALSLARVLATRQTDVMGRTRYDIVTPAGRFEPHWWDVSNAPMLDASGEVTAIIHQVHRVTDVLGGQAEGRQGGGA